MKMPDKHTIDKVLRNAASKEEAKEEYERCIGK